MRKIRTGGEGSTNQRCFPAALDEKKELYRYSAPLEIPQRGNG